MALLLWPDERRHVSLELLTGNATANIAKHLFISPHTVHDHLKSLFEKGEPGSRGELVARLVTQRKPASRHQARC